MRGLGRGDRWWIALTVVLATIVGASGVAAAVSAPAVTRTVNAPALAVAAIDDGGGRPVLDATSTTTPPTRPAPVTTVATGVATTLMTKPVTPQTVPAAMPMTPPTVPAAMPTSTTTTAPRPTTTTTTNPSSWALAESGISVRVSIDPAVPRAGQPVHFIIDTSTSTGSYCCLNLLTVNGVLEPLPKGGPSQDANGATITSTHEVLTWTVPDAAALQFRLETTSLGGPAVSATQPAQPVSARLTGSTPIVS